MNYFILIFVSLYSFSVGSLFKSYYSYLEYLQEDIEESFTEKFWRLFFILFPVLNIAVCLIDISITRSEIRGRDNISWPWK